MKSKWFEFKDEALRLRGKGVSIRKIESRFGIPRSTLNGWFKDVELTQAHRNKLKKDWENALVRARKKAVLWHHAQKARRLEEAQNAANKILDTISINDSSVLELALAMLYIGEGTKKTPDTAIGNSDPLILQFFIYLLKNIYNLDVKKIRCDLTLRADQNPNEMKRYWAKILNLPLSNFKRVNVDMRTQGSKTYPHYKGVCNIRCGTVAIQRRLLYLANLFLVNVVGKDSTRP